MARERVSLKDASLQLLLAWLEFFSALARKLYEMFEMEAEEDGDSDPVEIVSVRNDGMRTSSGEADGEISREPLVEGIRYGILDDRLHAASVEAPRKYYAVARGRSPGVYTSWEEVEPLVTRFRGSRYKAFRTREDAMLFIVRESSKTA